MADPRYPDSVKMYLQTDVTSAGRSDKVTLFNVSSVNPQISNSDFVAVGNAFGSLCRWEPDYIRRVDSYDFAPDEFEEV